jgi:undecaprenol kinase
MFKYGLNGIKLAIAKSKLALLCVFELIIILMCSMLRVSLFELFIIIICSAMLMALEMLNTSIEMICDLVDPNYNPQIKMIKDICAGAVLLFTIACLLIGCTILIPKVMIYFKICQFGKALYL